MSQRRSLFAELKRRNVIRAATFYAASAWLLVEVATQVFPIFDVADWVSRWIVIAALIGFPFAMGFAWLYEWTPEGIRRESDVGASESIVRLTGKRLDRWIIAVLTLALVALLVNRFVPRGEAPALVEKSIAVLPLSNVSGDDNELFFSDGLSEDLIAALSQIRTLKVISRNSSFKFRDSDEDSRIIGDRLGAAHLLEGSVRRDGGQVRVTLALINAADSSTLWSQSYDRPYKDLFALQDDITRAVATALEAKLLANSAAVVKSDRPPSGNLEAYSAYLQGKFYYARHSEADYRRAVDYYTAATHLDPGYAFAYAGLTYAWTDLAGYYLGGDDAVRAYAQARVASVTALRLDPQLALAHAARGWLLYSADLDWSGAEAEFQRALQLAPQDNDAKSKLASLLATLGQLPQSIDLIRQSIVTDPLYAAGFTDLSSYLSPLGRLDEAEKAIRTAIELQPEAGFERVQLVMIEIQRGDAKAALDAAHRVHDDGGWMEIALALALQINDNPAAADAALKTLIDTQANVSAFQIAQVYALRNDPDKVFEWLNRAWDNRDPGIGRLWFDPYILRYQHDPRFVAFCNRVGLPSPGTKAPMTA